MKIIVEPASAVYLNNYIKKGCDAFLFSIKDLSINNRNAIGITVLRNIKSTLDKKIELYLRIDKNMMNSDLEKLEKTLLKIENIGVNGIIFYDLAVLKIATKLNLKTPLILGQNFLVNNYETINYYHSKGVAKVIISGENTTEEIIEMKKNVNIPVMINIFGYQLMSFSKRKLLTNYFKNYKKPMLKQNYLIKDDRNIDYPIVEDKDGTKIYSNNILNGIMEINKLKESNIEYVILKEYLLKHPDFMKILEIYQEVIKKNVEDSWIRAKRLEIIKMYSNFDDGFFNKKTIFKVKS